MDSPNPYGSPNEIAGPPDDMTMDDVDPAFLKRIAERLDEARRQPPTAMGSLVQWARIVGLAALGIVALLSLSEASDGAVSSNWLAAFGGFAAGVLLRDVFFVQRLAKLWKPQSHFIDWKKVDETLRQP